jgi:hypothetical protein
MKYIVLTVVLSTGAIYAQGTIKNRLGQKSSKNLAQVQQDDSSWNCDNVIMDSPILGELHECPCNSLSSWAECWFLPCLFPTC